MPSPPTHFFILLTSPDPDLAPTWLNRLVCGHGGFPHRRGGISGDDDTDLGTVTSLFGQWVWPANHQRRGGGGLDLANSVYFFDDDFNSEPHGECSQYLRPLPPTPPASSTTVVSSTVQTVNTGGATIGTCEADDEEEDYWLHPDPYVFSKGGGDDERDDAYGGACGGGGWGDAGACGAGGVGGQDDGDGGSSSDDTYVDGDDDYLLFVDIINLPAPFPVEGLTRTPPFPLGTSIYDSQGSDRDSRRVSSRSSQDHSTESVYDNMYWES